MEAERKSAKNKWNDVQTERGDKKSKETHNKQMERRTDKIRDR
jgi:hypothetical protein